jgi:hypothetical protein
MSFFEGELDESASKAWNIYFVKFLTRLNQHMIDPNPALFTHICDSLRHIAHSFKNVDAQNHIVIDKKMIENQIASDNLNTPTNNNIDIEPKGNVMRPSISTDLNISV